MTNATVGKLEAFAGSEQAPAELRPVDASDLLQLTVHVRNQTVFWFLKKEVHVLVLSKVFEP